MQDIHLILDKLNDDKTFIDNLNEFLVCTYNSMIRLELSFSVVEDFLRRYYELSEESIDLISKHPDRLKSISSPQLLTYDTAYNEFNDALHKYIINNDNFDIYEIDNLDVLNAFKKICVNKNNRCVIGEQRPVRITSDMFDDVIHMHMPIHVYSKKYLRKLKEEA